MTCLLVSVLMRLIQLVNLPMHHKNIENAIILCVSIILTVKRGSFTFIRFVFYQFVSIASNQLGHATRKADFVACEQQRHWSAIEYKGTSQRPTSFSISRKIHNHSAGAQNFKIPPSLCSRVHKFVCHHVATPIIRLFLASCIA